jgi:hypothetical protein
MLDSETGGPKQIDKAYQEVQVDLFASPDLVPVDEDEHHGFTQRDKFTIEVHQAVISGSTTKDNSGGSEIKKVDEYVGG